MIGKKFRKLPGILRAERAHFPRRRPVKLVHAKRREHFAVFGEIPDLQPPILPQDKIHALPECASVFPLGILRRGRREAEGIERPGRDALERHGKPRLSERQTALRIKGTVRKNIPALQLVGTVFYIRLHAAAVIQLVSSGQSEALGIKFKTVGLRDLPQLCRGLRRRRPVCLAGFAQSVVPLREAPVGFRPDLPLCRGPRPPCGGTFVRFCAAQSVRHNDNAVRSLNGICLILPVQQPGSIGRGSEQQRERRGKQRRVRTAFPRRSGANPPLPEHSGRIRRSARQTEYLRRSFNIPPLPAFAPGVSASGTARFSPRRSSCRAARRSPPRSARRSTVRGK